MRTSQRLTTIAVGAAITLTCARLIGAQTTLRQTDPVRSVDRNTKEYPVSADVLWKALQQSYREAGIKATSVDPDTYQISYVANPAGPKVGNAKIENLVDCGGDKKSPLARTTALVLTVRSQVTTRGGGSTLRTFVEAIPVTNGSDSASGPTCSTRYTLERKLEPQLKLAFTVTGVGVGR